MSIRRFLISLSLILMISALAFSESLPETLRPNFSYDLKDKETATWIFMDTRIIDANNDEKKWTHENGSGFKYEYNEKKGADDWLGSRFIAFEMNHTYRIDVGVRCSGAEYEERVEVYMANSQTYSVDVFKDQVIPPTIVNSDKVTTLSGTYTVKSIDYDYFILGVHACSDPDKNCLYISSLAITDLGVLQQDDAANLVISDLSVEGDNLVAGYVNTVKATISNNGSRASTPCAVVFDFGNDDISTVSCPSIEAEESIDITTDFTPSLFESSYNLSVSLDSEEYDGDNANANTNLSGALSRPTYPSPYITDVYQPIRYQIRINWAMPSENQTLSLDDNEDDPGSLLGFNIYRNQQFVVHVGPTARSFLNSVTELNETFVYHVNAVYANGVSDLSNSQGLQVNTLVDEVAVNAIDVMPIEGGIVVNGKGLINVYDTFGRLINKVCVTCCGSVVKLSPGIYFIKTDGITKKIIVK